MESYEKIYNQAYEAQLNAIKVIMEAQKMKETVAEKTGKDINPEFQMATVPFAAYEMLEDRHDAEKESMRKHYRKVIAWICAALIAFIVAVFGSVLYFLNSYEIAGFSQDVERGNANIIGNDGDIINGEADSHLGQTEVRNS